MSQWHPHKTQRFGKLSNKPMKEPTNVEAEKQCALPTAGDPDCFMCGGEGRVLVAKTTVIETYAACACTKRVCPACT